MYGNRANSKRPRISLSAQLAAASTGPESEIWDKILDMDYSDEDDGPSKSSKKSRAKRRPKENQLGAYKNWQDMYRQSHINSYYPAVKQSNFPRAQTPHVNSLPVKQSRINNYFPRRNVSNSNVVEQYPSPEEYEPEDFYPPIQQVNDFVPDAYQSYDYHLMNRGQNEMNISTYSRKNYIAPPSEYYQNDYVSQIGNSFPRNIQNENYLIPREPQQRFSENERSRKSSKVTHGKFTPEPRRNGSKLEKYPKALSTTITHKIKDKTPQDEVKELLTAFKQSETQGVGDSLIKKEVQKVEKVEAGLLLLMGTVNQVSSWCDMLVNSKANILYQVIGQLKGIEPGRSEWQEKLITILGEENKTLNFVYYETDRDLPSYPKGSFVCCTGKMLASVRMQLFDIQLLNNNDKNSIARATFFSDRAVRNLVPDSTEFCAEL